MFYRFVVGNAKLEKFPDQLIGEGAFAQVMCTKGTTQAFKIFKTALIYRNTDDVETAFQDYQKVISTLKAINHKNILKITGAFVMEHSIQDYRWFVVMEMPNNNIEDN